MRFWVEKGHSIPFDCLIYRIAMGGVQAVKAVEDAFNKALPVRKAFMERFENDPEFKDIVVSRESSEDVEDIRQLLYITDASRIDALVPVMQKYLPAGEASLPEASVDSASSPVKQPVAGVKETGRPVSLLQEMLKDRKRQRRPFGEMVSLVISLSAFTAFGGFFGAVFAGVLKSGVWMSLALTVAILGAGTWVAAAVLKAAAEGLSNIVSGLKTRGESRTRPPAGTGNPRYAGAEKGYRLLAGVRR